MTGIPAWEAATTGQPPLASQINQFLGPHPSNELYAAVQTAAQTTAGSTTTNTNGTYLAQSFTTAGGQTAIGYVIVPVTTTTTSGSSLATTTVGLFANSAGAPAGSALVSTTITAEYANLASGGTNTVKLIYPLPATGLTASTTYWIVVAAAGNVSNSYTWFQSNQVSGASTSPDGVTWTAQGYGFEYQVFDQTASGLLTAVVEDSGSRWTVSTYTATGEISTYGEYTAGQTASGYLQSYRTYSYSNGLLTGVS